MIETIPMRPPNVQQSPTMLAMPVIIDHMAILFSWGPGGP